MKNSKRVIAGAMALLSAVSVASCGSSSGGDSSSSYVDKVKVASTDDIATIPDGSEKELEWLSYFDINPTKKEPEKRTDLTLFEEKGGKIKYSQTSSMNKYDKLAARLMSNNPPDMFWYEQSMTFPANCIKEMFQPVDDIVDFDSAMWSDVKDVAEQFTLNGKHFVAPINFLPGSVITYDKSMIDAAGLDDPYELYQNNEWNWDNWYDMMSEFVSNAPADVERFGINGWFQTQVIQQTGKTMVNYDGEKFTNNINDPDIERAEDLLYQVGKNNLVNGNWLGNAKQALKDGNLLFYCMGTWAMTGNNGPSDADTWRVVPVPSDPNTDEKYMTSDMTAYMWVRGSTAKEAVKCWYECCRMANTDETYKENGKEKFLNANPNWTEDMYQVIVDCSSSEYNQVFDYGYGISSTMSDDNANEDGNCVTRKLYEYTNKADDNGKQFSWTELRESYSATVDAELKTINDAVVAFNKKNS